MSNGELCLVTGGTGFLAGHVVADLLRHGYRVRGTVRDLGNTAKSAHLTSMKGAGENLELVQADLLDDDASWQKVVTGCTYVFHMASPFIVGISDDEAEEKLFKPAREGTLSVLRAAHAAGGVSRVVLTSSMAAINSGHDPVAFLKEPEKQWTNLEKADNYSKSKTMAERAAWDFVKECKAKGEPVFELSTINPTLVIGPTLSSSFATSHEFPYRLLARKMPAVPDMKIGTVDVRDVAAAHRLAATVPEAAGERFALWAQETSIQHWSRVLAKEFAPLGYKVPTTRAPYPLLWLLSWFDQAIAVILPRVGKSKSEVDNSKVQRVLGLTFTEEEKSMIDAGYACIEHRLKGIEQTKEYKDYLAAKTAEE